MGEEAFEVHKPQSPVAGGFIKKIGKIAAGGYEKLVASFNLQPKPIVKEL